jgi:hypothetical protein
MHPHIAIPIAKTEFFDAASTQPGQPGVFEVRVAELEAARNAVGQSLMPEVFAYFNGVSFGPARLCAAFAMADRFSPVEARTITHFRGLSIDAS